MSKVLEIFAVGVHRAAMKFGPEDLAPLARGCRLLGSGGGGQTEPAEQVARAALAAGPVEVVPVSSLADGQRVVVVGAVGSPTIMRERLPSLAELRGALDAVAGFAGRPDVLVPLEIGGLNGPLAVAFAASAGLPLADADTMGRAWPGLARNTVHPHVAATPLALSGPAGGSVVMQELAPDVVEPAIAAVVSALGGWAAFAGYPALAGAVRAHLVTGSLTRALRLGSESQLERLPEVRRTWTGTVVEVRPPADGRPGWVALESPVTGEMVRVDVADEFVCALLEGVTIGRAPDIVALTDARTDRALGTSEVRAGQVLRLVVLSPPPEIDGDPGRWGPASYAMEAPMEEMAWTNPS